MTQWTFHSLASTDVKTMARVFDGGTAPEIDALVGWEFRGWNVLPIYGVPLFWAMGNMRFIKWFRRTPDGEGAEGGNFKVTRGGMRAPWTCVPSDANPAVNGVYSVFGPGESERSNLPHAVFLDYYRAENHLFTGKYLRDYVVCANDADPDLLVGRADLHLGPLTNSGYFVLERFQPLRSTDR